MKLLPSKFGESGGLARLAALLTLPLATAGCPSTFAVTRHDTASIDSEQALRILGDSWRVLDTDDGAGDVRCNVEALRGVELPAVTRFTAGTGVINSEEDYEAVYDAPGFVKVVNEINWCRELLGGVLGCTPMGGSGMVVVRHTPSVEGILWAHEYGHSRGNPDVEVMTRVMNDTLVPAARTVTAAECTNYQD